MKSKKFLLYFYTLTSFYIKSTIINSEKMYETIRDNAKLHRFKDIIHENKFDIQTSEEKHSFLSSV